MKNGLDDNPADDADLDTADRGDDLTEDQAKADDDDDAGKADDDDDAGKADDDADDDAGKAADDKVDEDKDENNFPIRLNKAKEKALKANERADKAEAELAAFRAAAAPKVESKEEPDPIAAINTELDGLYVEVEEARADGDTKAAARIQRTIDTKNREIAKYEAAAISQRTTAYASESARFDTLLDVAETRVSAIDPKHAEFSREAVGELEFQVAAYEKMGMAGTRALHKAIKVLFGVDLMAAPEAKAAEADDPAAVDPDKKPEGKKPDAKQAVDTTRRQPPDIGDRGVNKDTTRLRASELSDEDYEKLPESKKAEMRGDFI